MILDIKYANLLDPFLKEHIIKKYPDYIFPVEEEVQNKVKIFREIPVAEYIEKMEKFFNLSFKRNIIPVYIVSAIDRDMSAPLIIRSRYNKEEFTEVLLHELVHCLMTDNHIVFQTSIERHIPVFKFLKSVDMAKEEPKDYDYKTAWHLAK